MPVVRESDIHGMGINRIDTNLSVHAKPLRIRSEGLDREMAQSSFLT